ncbi:MAG: methyltransferase domain-containing protein [bacterium]
MADEADDTDDGLAARTARKGMFKRAVAQVSALATTTLQEGDGFVQHLYDDYESYRLVQEEGNKAKLRAQFVKKSHIVFLANWLTATRDRAGLGPVSFALCHGVRRGKEQMWFRRRLDGAEVIGTDISETAKAFDNTVQWDFHDENPDWEAKADFVYSNSWDHAYDPGKAFRAWAGSLKPGGLILLDHTSGHMPKSTSVLDPFGATRDAVIRILDKSCGDLGRVTEVLDRTGDPDYPATVIVFTRNG